MTIFCGVWAEANETGNRHDLELMMRSISNPHAKHTAHWTSECISLGQSTVDITPIPVNEQFPYYQAENELVIVGDIRLDNRPELLAQLGLTGFNPDNWGDPRLILAAYKKWGDRFPERLLGDFSFTIWDGFKNKLFCCVDHFGNRGLFYFYNKKKFIFASTTNQILAAKDVPYALNYNKVSTIAVPAAKRLFDEESWFQNIYPVPSATLITIDKNGINKRKYWTPKADRELSFKNEDEFAEAFREVMFRAVSDRLRSGYPVTAFLSGGLDSSAVVSVAAKILEKQNKELQVLSAVLPDSKDLTLTDERHFIDQFKSFPNVKINYVTAPGVGYLSYIEDLDTKVNSPTILSRYYLNQALIEKAKSFGSRVIFDGIGGELGASCYANGAYAEWFLKLRWQHLWSELHSRRLLTGETFRGNLFFNILKPVLAEIAGNRLNSKQVFQQKQTHSIQKELSAGLEKMLLGKVNVNIALSSVIANHRINQMNDILTRQGKARGTADFGEVEFRHPLMDVRLLEFCLAAPPEYKIKNGFKRYLLRAGLNDILPPEIQWRNSKSPFSPDYIRRYKQQLGITKEFLNAIGPNDPVRHVVDIEQLKEWTNMPLADNESGTYAEVVARDLVPEGIYLIRFLRRFKEFQL